MKCVLYILQALQETLPLLLPDKTKLFVHTSTVLEYWTGQKLKVIKTPKKGENISIHHLKVDIKNVFMLKG